MTGVLEGHVKFRELSRQHIKALIDLRTEELRRAQCEVRSLSRELDDLYLILSEKSYIKGPAV